MLCLQAKIMAAKDNKKRGEVPEPTRWSNEITGIILITVGLLLLLSLVKYSPADLPRWGLLEAFAGKSGAASENLIGPVGGIIGFLQILLFGAAGGLIPVGFIWFGIVKLAFDGHVWPRAVIGFSILLLAAAAWLHAANFFFVEWAMNCSLNGPGGVIGAGLGGFVLTNVIGKAGTLILTSAAYLVALILLTGQEPVRFSKACYRLARRKFHEWQTSRSAAGKIAAREAEMLAERGLKRAALGGTDGLRLIMMCEVPSNAILAEQFLEYFDGMSIGSNDLTQLTLGLDRDSGLELLAADFDERDPAVKALISRAIVACRATGKYIGICGQGPSDHPDFADWLAAEGIVSISLNPDTVIDTWKNLAG